MKAGKASFLSTTESIGAHAITKWLVLLLYVAVVTFLAMHHEPWSDEYNVWSMDYRMSLRELFASMRFEGHFCLWHLLVLPFVKLGMDYHALFVVSISMMTLAAWLLLFEVDFPFVGKLFVIFSAPFFYYFPVIARCYALIPPIVIALVAVYQRKSSSVLYCTLLGLLAHTHAYMEGLVAILWILFFYHYVLLMWKEDPRRARKNLWASLITVFLVLLAFVQILGGFVDAVHGIGPAVSCKCSEEVWILRMYESHRVRICYLLQKAISLNAANLDLLFTMSGYVAICSLLSLSIFKRPGTERNDFLWIASVGALWQLYFSINIYFMECQRVWLFFIPVFVALGFVYHKKVAGWAVCIMALFWLLNTPSQYKIFKDIGEEYSYDVRIASEMEKLLPEEAEIMATDEIRSCKLIRRPFEYVEMNAEGTLMIEEKLKAGGAKKYLLTSRDFKVNPNLGVSFVPVYSGVEGDGDFSFVPKEISVTLYAID